MLGFGLKRVFSCCLQCLHSHVVQTARVPLLHTAASVGKSLAVLRSLIAGLPRGSVSASRSPVILLSFFNQIVPKGSVGRNTRVRVSVGGEQQRGLVLR